MPSREWIKIPPRKDMQSYDLYTCPICDFYMLWTERNRPGHKKRHNHILDVIDKHGLFLGHSAREALKVKAYKQKIDAETIEEKKFAFLVEWYSRFMRSLGAYYNTEKHPSFEDYISMILYQSEIDDFLEKKNGKEIIASLIDEFGTLKGIPSGSYYYDDQDSISNAIEYPRNKIQNNHKELAIMTYVDEWLAERLTKGE